MSSKPRLWVNSPKGRGWQLQDLLHVGSYSLTFKTSGKERNLKAKMQLESTQFPASRFPGSNFHDPWHDRKKMWDPFSCPRNNTTAIFSRIDHESPDHRNALFEGLSIRPRMWGWAPAAPQEPCQSPCRWTLPSTFIYMFRAVIWRIQKMLNHEFQEACSRTA